jgi:hypothetical protein
MNPKEKEAQQFLIEVLEDELENAGIPLKDIVYRSFVSRSAGRKRKRNKWVEVELIGLSGGKFVSLTNGRLPKKKKTRMDSVAEEALGDNYPPNISPLDHFLNLLRQRERRYGQRSRG